MARLRYLAVAVLALFAFTGAGAGAAAPPPDTASPDTASLDAARKGAAFLAGTQGDNGAMAAGWRPDQVAEAVMAVHIAGGQDGAVADALDFIAQNGDAGASSGPFAGRIVSALVSVGADPRDFGGVNYVARTKSFYEPATGEYGGPNLYADLLAMVGILAAGESLQDQSLNRILLTQCDDGGWTHAIGCRQDRDVDTTALALAVLVKVRGADDEAVRDGRAWLADAQNDSGCWGYTTGAADNANSCALALNTVTALGEDGSEAAAALRALQLDSGAFRYMANRDEPNNYATVQTVFALAGGVYPTTAPAPVPPPGDDDDDDDSGGGPVPTTRVTRPDGTSGGDDDSDDDGAVRVAAPSHSAGPAATSTTTTAPVKAGGVLSALGLDEEITAEASVPAPVEPGSGAPVTVTDEDGGEGRGPALAVAAGLLGAAGAGVGWWGRRRSALAALGLLALVAIPLVGVAGAPEACLAAPGEIQVRVVVDYGTLPDAPDHPTDVTCVTVPEGATGSDVLAARAEKLDLPAPRYEASGLLCAIDGYPTSGCGEQTATGYQYWGYYLGTAKGWEYADVGPAGHPASAGVTEGWRFNNGAGPENPPPREPSAPGCTPAEMGTPLTAKEEDSAGFPVAAAAGAMAVAGMGTAGVVVARRRQGS